ncbi:hypothetical protein FRB91_006417, partial [Serendipita sp. 411]
MSTPQPVLPLSVARLAQSAPPRPLAPNENDIGLKLVSMPGSPYPYKVPHFREDTPDATSYPGVVSLFNIQRWPSPTNEFLTTKQMETEINPDTLEMETKMAAVPPTL